MRTGNARITRVSSPDYHAAPHEAYARWLADYRARNREGRSVSAAILRRIVQLRHAGDSWSEIARCCGVSRGTPKRIYERLPEALR